MVSPLFPFAVRVTVTELFDPSLGVPVLVVTFLALLELARETLIDVTQSEGFAPIYIRIVHVEPN